MISRFGFVTNQEINEDGTDDPDIDINMSKIKEK